jgi:dolichol-phosphate mannosyltransferase
VAGGSVEDWGLARRAISRGGSIFARTVLALGPRDLTGGLKAWRRTTLESVVGQPVHAGGYVFQIEMTFRASRVGGRVREIPIVFRDRRVGASKMSRRIIAERSSSSSSCGRGDRRGRGRSGRPRDAEG